MDEPEVASGEGGLILVRGEWIQWPKTVLMLGKKISQETHQYLVKQHKYTVESWDQMINESCQRYIDLHEDEEEILGSMTFQITHIDSTRLFQFQAKPPSSPPWRADGGSELAAAESKAKPQRTVKITPANPLVAAKAAKPTAAPPPAVPTSSSAAAAEVEDDARDGVPEVHQDDPQSLEDTLQLMLRSCESDDIMILGLHYLVLVVDN
eukprot:s308_g26.t1